MKNRSPEQISLKIQLDIARLGNIQQMIELLEIIVNSDGDNTKPEVAIYYNFNDDDNPPTAAMETEAEVVTYDSNDDKKPPAIEETVPVGIESVPVGVVNESANANENKSIHGNKRVEKKHENSHNDIITMVFVDFSLVLYKVINVTGEMAKRDPLWNNPSFQIPGRVSEIVLEDGTNIVKFKVDDVLIPAARNKLLGVMKKMHHGKMHHGKAVDVLNSEKWVVFKYPSSIGGW